MYLSAIIVLHKAEEIFNTPCEMPLIHQMLSNVTPQPITLSWKDINNLFIKVPEDLQFDSLILETRQLMKVYPPDVIKKAVKEHSDK